MSVARALWPELITELRQSPELQREFCSALGLVEPKPESLYETVDVFRARFEWSRRHIFKLIKQGLPVVGNGKARRVDVERARKWLADREGT